MLTEKELNFQKAILSVQKRLLKHGSLARISVRQSCLGFDDAEFERLLDAIVAGGMATRERGKNGGELYRSVVHAE